MRQRAADEVMLKALSLKLPRTSASQQQKADGQKGKK